MKFYLHFKLTIKFVSKDIFPSGLLIVLIYTFHIFSGAFVISIALKGQIYKSDKGLLEITTSSHKFCRPLYSIELSEIHKKFNLQSDDDDGDDFVC